MACPRWCRLLPALLLGLAVALASPAWSQPPLRTVPLPGPAYPQVTAQGRIVYQPAQAVADRLILIMDRSVAPAAVNPLAAVPGARVRRALPRVGLTIVDLPPDTDLLQAAARFNQQPGVLLAVPDTLVYPQVIPNDPKYPQQYHLPLCRAPEGWEATTGSRSTVIAVIDSGVDLNHPDLAGKIWTNPNPGSDPRYPNDVHGWNFVENNNNVQPVPKVGEDNSIVSHGTLAAGLAAAVTNDGWGAAGVDWRAQIMPVKVFSNSGNGTVSSVVEAIDYAVARGAKIINLSLGGSYNEAFTPPIVAAYNAGVVVVCAGGNQGSALSDNRSSWQSPVCNDGNNPLTENMVCGVGATDRYDRKAYYSNWDTSTGKHFIDVCAPGDAVYGPVFHDPSFPGFGEYWGTNSGTSFSSPIVAGLAGLILAQDPTLTPAQVIARLRSTADNIDAANPGYAGRLGGRINIARALGVASPPLPVSNVQASDTPGDEGGSITVTWTKSGDDGAGANNVTKYVIRRRQGASGNFQVVGEKPPGSVQYVDKTTTDGVDYYYVVRTFAGTRFSDSEVAGPVQSRNDQPPPPVTSLTAADRAGDSGGAIQLNWTYAPPPDFREFRLYRQNYNFTNVAGRAAVAVITDPAARSYTDTSVTDGVDYYYALTAVDTEGNENKNVSAVGPVQSFPNQDLTFPAGVQLLATPVIPAGRHPATLLGLSFAELRCARWDPAVGDYVRYTGEPLPAFLRLTLGRGFWVDLPRAVTVTPTGQAAPAGDFPVVVVKGWQMLGNPFFGAIAFDACTVTYGGNTMDLAAAESAGLLRSVAWVWDPAVRGYRLINADVGGSRLIAPWQGFWVEGLKACTLNLVRPGGVPATAVRPQAASRSAAPDWLLRLAAEAGGYQDLDNFCGPAAEVREVASPPLPGVGVDLSFAGATGSSLAVRTFLDRAGPVVQPVTVSWMGVAGTVRLTWPTVNTLPADKSFVLTDLATGRAVNLRNTPAYVFAVSQPVGQRDFHLTISDRSPASLQVTALSAQATSQGAQIVFTLSQSATCDLEIRNIAGRSLRRLLVGALRPAGQNTLLWDGRNQAGARVPAGRYLVSLQARDDQGGMVHLLHAFSVIR